MDSFVFFLLSISFLPFWLCIYWSSPNLRRKLWIASLVGGVTSLISEYWYLKDYWHPPYTIGYHGYSLEDFLFGFFVTGTVACIYDFLLIKKVASKQYRAYLFLLPVFAVFTVLAFFILVSGLHISSALVSPILFLLFALIALSLRRDLVERALVSMLCLLGFIFPLYLFLFGILAPHWWDRYSLLIGTHLGSLLFGAVPITELLWCAGFGLFGGIWYEFFFGQS